MEENTLKQLEEQLEKNLIQFLSSAEQTIQNRSQILSVAARELIELHSNQIRNLSLISGVIAPLSLTLLQIQGFDIYVPFLLAGFILLLGNIILSQLLLGKELNRKNKLIGKSVLEFISASTNKWTIEDKTQQSSERAIKAADFVKNIDEFDRHLGISPLSVEPMSTNERLRKYNRWMVGIFSLGCGLVIFSIFFNPLIQVVANILSGGA